MTISLWRRPDNGKLIRDGSGKLVYCDHCPCEPITPCSACPDSPSPIVYFWFTYLSNSSFGCFDVPSCLGPDVTGPNSLWFLAGYGGSIRFNSLPNSTSFGAIDCVNTKLTTTCTDSGTTLNVFVDNGGGYVEQNIVTACDWVEPTCVADNANNKYYYLSTTDPASGIGTPAGTKPAHLFFSIVLGGITYTCDMTFSAGVNGIPFFSPGPSCWSWFGFFTDCQGYCTRVEIYYNPGDGWYLLMYNPGPGGGTVTLYFGAGFPPASGMHVGHTVCGDDPTWSLSAFGAPLLSQEPAGRTSIAGASPVQEKAAAGCCGKASDKSPLRVERKPKI